MLMIVNFFSPDGRYDDIYLSNFATINVRDELLRVDGRVGHQLHGPARLQHPRLARPAEAGGAEHDRHRRGGRDPQPEPRRARRRRSASRRRRAGQPFQLPIDTLGRLTDPEQFGDIIVKVGCRAGPRRHARSRSAPARGGTDDLGDASNGCRQRSSAFDRRRAAAHSTTPTSGRGADRPSRTAAIDDRRRHHRRRGDRRRRRVAASQRQRRPARTPPAQRPRRSPHDRPASAVEPAAPSVAARRAGRGPGRPSARDRPASATWPASSSGPRTTTVVHVRRPPSVGLGVYQLPGTNALDVADAVRRKMEELKKRFPDGMDYEIGYDTTPFIRESVGDVVWTMLRSSGPGRRSSCCCSCRTGGR